MPVIPATWAVVLPKPALMAFDRTVCDEVVIDFLRGAGRAVCCDEEAMTALPALVTSLSVAVPTLLTGLGLRAVRVTVDGLSSDLRSIERVRTDDDAARLLDKVLLDVDAELGSIAISLDRGSGLCYLLCVFYLAAR